MTAILSHTGCFLEVSLQRPQASYVFKDGITGEESTKDAIDTTVLTVRHNDKSYKMWRVPYMILKQLNPVLVTGPPRKIESTSTISLREEQLPVLEHFRQYVHKDHFALLYDLPTAFGKTIVALQMAQEAAQSFLIVAPKCELIKQWTEEAKSSMSLDLRPVKWDDDCIGDGYVCTVQMLSRQLTTTPTKVYDWLKRHQISLLIVDEVHMMPTTCFVQVFMKMFIPKTIALTATLERKDQMHTIFAHCFEDVYAIERPGKKQSTAIKVVAIKNEEWTDIMQTIKGKKTFSTAKCMNQLVSDPNRFKVLCGMIQGLDHTRHCLCLSDRVEYCTRFYDALKDKISCGLIVGSNKKGIEEAKQGRVIFATYSMVNEGFNVPRLNTLILLTPRSSIEQTIGRIYRKHHDIEPLIIDVLDISSSLYNAQYRKRKALYRQKIEAPRFLKDKDEEKKDDEVIEFVL